MISKLTGLFIFLLLVSVAPRAGAIDVVIDPLAQPQSTHWLVGDYLKKILAERSHGRLQTEILSSRTSRSLNQAVEDLQRQKVQIIITELQTQHDLSSGSETAGMLTGSGKSIGQEETPVEMISRQNDLKILGCWKKNRLGSGADSTDPAVQESGLLQQHPDCVLFTVSAFWKTLPEDLKYIVLDAVKDSTRYAHELNRHTVSTLN